MQFSHISTALVLLVLTTFVSAGQTVTVTTYAPAPTSPPASQCDPAAIWCCNETEPANGPLASPLLALLGIVVVPVSTLVGIDCTSINALGIDGGGLCTAQPICCQYNNFAPLLVIGCTPVTIGE
ncbi:hypothetical protein K443DRAFT_123535 [Laccaria amethystina LaAM-08-1]|uniref:Hydrophobin n=1 Tax=Laccaria amethystina LaAM-08-1 TaxID=1095629 RepID=A0A0C9WN11_9AGAR|nr:hypothetical protein K443DRAFT_123535 [Laccaria amethystina LaAM-08-1]